MAPPYRLAMGKIPVELKDDTPKRQPSISDSHDDSTGSEVTGNERELFIALLQQSEERTAERINELSTRLEYVRSLIGSDRPGAVELKSPNGWRIKAKSGVAMVLLLMVLATVAAWKYEPLSSLFGVGQTISGP